MQMNDYSRAPRVLIVEDDEDIAQALQRSLRMEGYEVRAAADGAAALEHGRSFAPDLVTRLIARGRPPRCACTTAERRPCPA